MPSVYFFRSDPFIQMPHIISGDNEIKKLTLLHLKKCAQAEWNTFTKYLQKEVNDYRIEAKDNPFCQFSHNGATLRSKQKRQDFGI